MRIPAWGRKLIGQAKLIAIIEDDEQIGMLLSMFLKSRGYKTEWAKDGVEGVKLVDATLPELVLLDITMPKMDGFNVLLKIKSDPKTQSVPVLMFTDRSGLEDVEKCCRSGASGYILKPFDLERVLEKVKSILKEQ